MTRVVISQPMYFPWVGFIAQMALADVFVWLDDAHFSKGSFTNRVQVPSALNKTSWMSVPLLGKGSGQQIRDLTAAREDWSERHLSLLQNSYRLHPYKTETLDLAGAALADGSVCDRIIASCELLLAACGLALPPVYRSSELQIAGAGWPRVLQIVQAMNGTEYVTGHGARRYLDHDAFERAGITVRYMDYTPRPWPQDNEDFNPYVTGLDLIASVKPEHRPDHLNPQTVTWRDFVDQT